MIKQNPFSLYDFLGYFVPGAILVYFYLLLDFLEGNHNHFKLTEFLNDTGGLKLDQILFFVIMSYALGHLVNFISSITVEKYAIWKYDYPSKYLLQLEKRDYWTNGIGNLWRVLIPTFLFPITVWDFILGDALKFKNFYTRKLDDFLIGLIKEKGQKLLNKLFANESNNESINNNVGEYDFFRLFAHYTFENSKKHQSKIINYVALYGFLRVLCFISIITFWFLSFSMIVSKVILLNVLTLIIVSLVGYTFFMAFMKFYRRYTLEGLMLIAINEEL